jgi:hypothetical protein
MIFHTLNSQEHLALLNNKVFSSLLSNYSVKTARKEKHIHSGVPF